MTEQPQAGGRQIVLKRTRRIEEVHARNGSVEDFCGQRQKFEMVVVKLQLEEPDQERAGKDDNRDGPDDRAMALGAQSARIACG